MDRSEMPPDLRPQFQAEALQYAMTLPEYRKQALQSARTTHLVPIGEEQREGWTGKLLFYFFWCKRCSRFTKDYLHGFAGRQHINCSNCGAYYPFTSLQEEFDKIRDLVRLLITHRDLIWSRIRRRPVTTIRTVRS